MSPKNHLDFWPNKKLWHAVSENIRDARRRENVELIHCWNTVGARNQDIIICYHLARISSFVTLPPMIGPTANEHRKWSNDFFFQFLQFSLFLLDIDHKKILHAHIVKYILQYQEFRWQKSSPDKTAVRPNSWRVSGNSSWCQPILNPYGCRGLRLAIGAPIDGLDLQLHCIALQLGFHKFYHFLISVPSSILFRT